MQKKLNGVRVNNIILIGMPGAGKSTIGVLLAKALKMNFVDTDLLIQTGENRLLQDIINIDGIQEFLKCEEKYLLRVQCDNSVIATGGSAIYSSKAMDHLKKGGVVIYLKLGFEEIINRLKNIKTRGIVLEKGQSLIDAYNLRCPLYEKYADTIVNCSGKGIEEIIDTIKKFAEGSDPSAKSALATEV